MKPEPCTTHGARKRHLSVDLHADRAGRGARIGATLCGHNAYDQVAINARYRLWGVFQVPLIDQMPECGSCVKSAARIARGGQ